MAIIPQKQIFSWKEIENLADLQRFSLLIEYLPDEKLMQRLESLRSKGRNDYPVRAIWNSILAGIVYQHQSVESLRRELMRNAQLRQLCGFDLFKGIASVPSSNAYSNFLKLLVFTPLARSSYKWKTVYKKRSSVERVNSRLDESFGFEKHFIRGIKKMKVRCSLALIVMLGMAYGRVKEKQPDKLRSLVQPAA